MATIAAQLSSGISVPQQPIPEQESTRLREANELLTTLKSLLLEGEAPSIETLGNALTKAEELTLRAANAPIVDDQTRKVLEDITALLISARQLGRNKQIGDRLQKISDESAKALAAAKLPGASKETLQAGQNIAAFVANFRPVFYLMTSSREFRKLLLDISRLARRVLYGYTEDIKHEASQKFEQGDSVKDIALTAKDRVNEKGSPEISEEDWDRLLDDVQRVLVILSKEPSFRDGIERLFALLDMFQKSLATESITVKAAPHDIHARRVVMETEDLVAAFSGRETLEDFKYHLRNLIVETEKNENLHNYLFELKQFILKTKTEAEIQSKEFKHQSKDLAHRGRELMRELKDKEDVRPLLDAARQMIENIKNDEMLQLLSQHAGVLQTDLSFTSPEGKVQVNFDMISKLQSSLLPVIADTLKYIPVPKIHSVDKEREFWLDKVVLCSYDIIPENIRFHLEADSEVNFRDVEVKGTRTRLVIQLNKFLGELKNIEFFYHKKTFPELEEQGIVTFRIKGNGARLRFSYTLLQRPEDKVPSISEGHVSFDISDIEIEFNKDTLKHPLMVPMLTQMFKNQIRHEIEDQVENNLNGFLEKFGEVITGSLKVVETPFRQD
jgi:hypothetical protein